MGYTVVNCGSIGFPTLSFANFPWFLGVILRDGTGSGRGVHRFWGSPIQKSRSNFSPFFHFSHFSGIFGVGVVYLGVTGLGGLNWLRCGDIRLPTGAFSR